MCDLESWGGAVAFAFAVAGGARWIASEIGEVRTDLTAEIHALEVRMESRIGGWSPASARWRPSWAF
ncbi:MAG: hypothetical protein OXQ94_00555 [Gemmatimonadota bacterium]|nr:hypothetical protein [Gemmatimonadota bacterium]MDE2870170.1 hypothetical protein [Gemmatimonadota bacterium]